ncbi:MAG: MarR family transcriptional regulator [Acidimicrobiia bacterium]|nr:MarR family transcriptional regulator [Acidimicrobiia bacterium]
MADIEWLDERQARAWRSLQFMQARLEAQLNRQLMADSGLSLSDYVVLVNLTDQPDGRLRIFALAHEIGWERSRLSHHINRMANRGLVTKEACDSDRRGAYVVLTDEGRQAIEEAAPRHVAIVRRLVIDQIDAEELDVIGAAAEKVLTALAQAEL